MFPKPIFVQALNPYRLFLRYDDGMEGEVNLAHLAGQGIFAQWDENGLFSTVYIDPETDAIAWSEELEIGPDSLYLNLLGTDFQTWKNRTPVHAAH